MLTRRVSFLCLQGRIRKAGNSSLHGVCRKIPGLVLEAIPSNRSPDAMKKSLCFVFGNGRNEDRVRIDLASPIELRSQCHFWGFEEIPAKIPGRGENQDARRCPIILCRLMDVFF